MGRGIKKIDGQLTRRQSGNVRKQLAGQAAAIASRLCKAALGEIEMTPPQIKACQIVLDKCVPSLQSVDATVARDEPAMTEEQAVARLAQLLERHPELARVLGPKGVTVEGHTEPPTEH